MNQGDIFELLKLSSIFHMTQDNIVNVLADITGGLYIDIPSISRISTQKKKGLEILKDKADEVFDEFFAGYLQGKTQEELDNTLYHVKEWVKERNLNFWGMNSKNYDTCEKWIRQMLRCALMNWNTCANPQPGRYKRPAPRLKAQNFPKASTFIGREDLIDCLNATLNTEHVAVLQGAEGIGKSFAAQQFAALHREDYTCIQEVKADSTNPAELMHTLVMNVAFDGMKKVFQDDSEEFSAKLSALKNIDTPSLLILDSVNVLPGDVAVLREIVREASSLHIIITTRMPKFLNSLPSLDVVPLKLDEQIMLFWECFGGNSSHEDSGKLRKILHYMDGNTMCIESAARYMQVNGYSFDSMSQRIAREGIFFMC